MSPKEAGREHKPSELCKNSSLVYAVIDPDCLSLDKGANG